MEALFEKFGRDEGSSLRRSRSVRASLRLIGTRWKPQKEEEPPKLRRNGILFSTQIWSDGKDLNYANLVGVVPKSVMAKRKHELKQRRKSGDVDLLLKPYKHGKVEKEKNKLSELFSNKKYKSQSAKELVCAIPSKVPPKAAAILNLNPSVAKTKVLPKCESARSLSELTINRRMRRNSESDTNGLQGHHNAAFVYSTPPNERRKQISPTAFISTYYFEIKYTFLVTTEPIALSTKMLLISANFYYNC